MYLELEVNVGTVLPETEYSGLSLVFLIEHWESSNFPIKGHLHLIILP